MKLLEDFDLTWLKGGLTKKKFSELSSLAFIHRRENIVLLGSSGIGKTHLLLGFGHKACCERPQRLLPQLYGCCGAVAEGQGAEPTQTKTTMVMQTESLTPRRDRIRESQSRTAHVFFQLVNVRYEVGSMILTSNRPFGQCSELMGDDAVATATLDRVLHHAHVLSLKGDSYRMKDRLKLGVVDFG